MCFTIYHWHTKLLSIRLELFISPKLQVVLRMSSIFSRNKVMIPIVLSQSLWMFPVWLDLKYTLLLGRLMVLLNRSYTPFQFFRLHMNLLYVF